MPFRVVLGQGAIRDLDGLFAYLIEEAGEGQAARILARITEQIDKLKENPDRGTRPSELTELGIRAYRQLHFGPYRIIYQVQGRVVYVLVIADGRRDMRSLLERRLFEAE